MSKHDHQAVLRQLDEIKADVRKPVVPVEKRSKPMEVEEFDLDKELEVVSQAVEEFEASQPEPEPVEATPPAASEQLEAAIIGMLHAAHNAPTPEQVKGWKAKYGQNSIQVIAFDTDNVFVYTHLTVSQWEKMNKLKEGLQKQDAEGADKRMREAILKTAVLWPKLDTEWFQNSRAGLPNSLVEIIMMNSYFLQPSQLLTLTAQL